MKLAEAGVSVCINYFDADELAHETLNMILAAGGKAILAQGDMHQSCPKSEKCTVDQCIHSFGSEINILVNVAGGLMGRKTMEEIDEEFWDIVMNVNLKTVFLVTKEVLPKMPFGGSIVNFASQAARDGGGQGTIAYSTAKGGVLTMTRRGLAKELGPKGIRVNATSPGMINTTFHNAFTKQEVREKVALLQPPYAEKEVRRKFSRPGVIPCF